MHVQFVRNPDGAVRNPDLSVRRAPHSLGTAPGTGFEFGVVCVKITPLQLAFILLLPALGACQRFVPDSPPAQAVPGGGSGNSHLFAGFSGLQSALPGDGRIQITWSPVLLPTGEPDPHLDYHILLGDPSSGFPETVAAVYPATASAGEIVNLINGVAKTVAVRAVDPVSGVSDGNSAFSMAVPGAVRYCDDSAATPGDGLTPAKPLPSIDDALKAVAAAGGGAVYVAEGTYSEALRIPGNVGLYGGFDAAFDPAQRDPAAHSTLLRGDGIAGSIVKPATAANRCILDGVTVDGGDTTPFGVDFAGSDASIVNTTIRRCLAQGMRLQSGLSGGQNSVQVHRCSVRENLGEGLEINGTLDVSITDSEFAENINEGVEALSLSAPTGGKARIAIRRSTFVRNANEGLDVKLDTATPGVPSSSTGATLDVILENCNFIENRLSGAKLDIEFTDAAAIRSRLFVDHCIFRGNALEGVRLDLDATTEAAIYNSRASANLGAGFHLTGSEPGPVCIFVKNVALGNLGPAIQIDEGPLSASMIQNTFAGNLGRAANVTIPGSTLVNSLVAGAGAAGVDHSGTVFAPQLESSFVYAPSKVLHADAVVEATLFINNSAAGLAAGDLLEIADDGIVRTVTNVTNSSVDFDPPFPHIPLTLEAMVFQHAPGGAGDSAAQEDLTPSRTVLSKDAGLSSTFDADGSIADAGATGGESAAPQLAPTPLICIFVSPAAPALPNPGASISMRFNHAIDPASVATAPVLIMNAAGQPMATNISVVGNELQITPAAPLTGPAILVAGYGLRDIAGSRQVAPLVFYYHP